MTSSLLENLPLDSTELCDIDSSKKSMKPRRSWKEFMQRRNGTRVYVCNFENCGKAFNYLSSLVKHERIHRGERPYTCKVCNQSFVQSSNLKRHVRTHTGEKSFECVHCHKMFSTASNLRQHQQIHKEDTQRKHYCCNQCGRNYLYPSSLSKHVKFCDGTPESITGVEKSDEMIEEPTIKKLVKIEEKIDESSSETDQKTQSEERSESSSLINYPESKKLPTLESMLRQNNLLASTLPVMQPLKQQLLSYSTNDQLLNSLLLQKATFNPIQTIQPSLTGLLNPSVNVNMMNFANATSALLYRQQIQNRIIQQQQQQANFALGLGRIPFY